jgi:hypothetical protein
MSMIQVFSEKVTSGYNDQPYLFPLKKELKHPLH